MLSSQEQHISTKVGKHNPRATALQVVDRLSTTATRASPCKKTRSYVPPCASPFLHTQPRPNPQPYIPRSKVLKPRRCAPT